MPQCSTEGILFLLQLYFLKKKMLCTFLHWMIVLLFLMCSCLICGVCSVQWWQM